MTYKRIDYSNPTAHDLEAVLIELLHNGRDSARSQFRHEIANSYRQGVKDAQEKFVKCTEDVFTKQELLDILNGERRTKVIKQSTKCFLDMAERMFQAGETAIAVGTIINYLKLCEQNES